MSCSCVFLCSRKPTSLTLDSQNSLSVSQSTLLCSHHQQRQDQRRRWHLVERATSTVYRGDPIRGQMGNYDVTGGRWGSKLDQEP